VTFAAVISDFDGVLADSSAAIRRVWARWGERHGIDGAAIQAANHGRPSRAVVAEHVAPELVDAESAWVLEAEVADTRGVVAYPGADEVLALPVVAIATSCEAPLARARLAAAGLTPPAVVVTADQVAHGKPAPDPYLLAAERLGVDPAACLVLEDAPSGVAAGLAAGMTVWAVTTTHAPGELEAAERVAAGLPGLLAALDDRSDRSARSTTRVGETAVDRQ
jgi:mannitol-1-/sugar-/sorbitol-6-phosphatase